MSALCEKCKYEFTEMSLAGHISSELYTLYKETQNSKIKQSKGLIQNKVNDFITAFMNNQKIPCPKCKEYIAWLPNNN